MLGAGLCWSMGGIIVRSLTLNAAWEIIFWRALFMVLFLGTLMLALRGRGVGKSITALGRAGLLSGACLAAQLFLFVLALLHTTAANTFVLMSLAPLTAALAGALFLGERVARHTWGAIVLALAGVVIMLGSGPAQDVPGDVSGRVAQAHWLGNLFALGVPVGYACQIIFARKVKAGGTGTPDLLPTLLIAGLLAMMPALWLATPLQAGARDIGLLALMGCVQLGLGCWLMTLALRDLSTAEMGLLALTETLLAPLWVWLGVGEAPSRAALLGGALIIAALVTNAVMDLRKSRDTAIKGGV